MKTRSGIVCAFAALAMGLGFTLDANAQFGRTKTKADLSQRAVTGQVIGVDSEITIEYHRPSVKGREIWGTPLARYDRVWRAGANETTKITFDDDALVGGKKVAAGTYGLFVIPTESGDWTVIINKDWEAWGSFAYKEANDVARIAVKAEDASLQEQLTFGFEDVKADSAVAFLHWEKKKVSFKIELDD